MTKVPEDAVSADAGSGYDYDGIAEGYSAENETSLVNAYYERPAMLNLAGDVTGRRILDAGCGSGPLFAALRDRGALVTGVDASAQMPAGGWAPTRICGSPTSPELYLFPTAPSTT